MHPITVYSFGYLHPWPEGVEKPADEDTYDLRETLADPAHVLPEEKRDLTGLDDEICDFVFKTPGAMDLQVEALNTARGKARAGAVTVAFGCAGGRHRSVALARSLGEFLDALGYVVTVHHLHVHLPRVIRHNA